MRTIQVTVTPALRLADMTDLLRLRDQGCDVHLIGDGRISVPTDDNAAELWLRARGYHTQHTSQEDGRELPGVPILEGA